MKKKTQKFAHSYLGNSLLHDFLQNWYVVPLVGMQAPPQQLWHPLDKRSRSYECVEIKTCCSC